MRATLSTELLRAQSIAKQENVQFKFSRGGTFTYLALQFQNHAIYIEVKQIQVVFHHSLSLFRSWNCKVVYAAAAGITNVAPFVSSGLGGVGRGPDIRSG